MGILAAVEDAVGGSARDVERAGQRFGAQDVAGGAGRQRRWRGIERRKFGLPLRHSDLGVSDKAAHCNRCHDHQCDYRDEDYLEHLHRSRLGHTADDGGHVIISRSVIINIIGLM